MASNFVKWKCSGEITKSDFTKALPIGIQALMNDVGAKAVANMKAITSKHDASGSLTDSIMWVTAAGGTHPGGWASGAKEVEAPTDKYAVRAGSAIEHAIYRETESGIHLTDDGSDLFIERMKGWYWIKFKANPDAPENSYSFYKLLETIRNTKTVGVPFVKPTKDMIVPYANTRFKSIMNKALRTKK